MNRLPFFLLLIGSQILAGCATTVDLSKSSDTGSATVVGQIDRSLGYTNWREYSLLSVDGSIIRPGFMVDARDTVAKVPAGTHKFVIQAMFLEGFGNGPWAAIVPLTSEVKANVAYRINGVVKDELFYVWLEDEATKIRASNEASAPFRRIKVQNNYIPVIIPAR